MNLKTESQNSRKTIATFHPEQLRQFMVLANIYGWEKSWKAFSGYLKTEKLREKWVG